MDVKKNIKMLILGTRNKNESYNLIKSNLKNDEMIYLKKNYSSNYLKKQNVQHFPNIQKLNHSIQLNKKSYDYMPQILNGNLRKNKSESKFQNISLRKGKKIEKNNLFLFPINIVPYSNNSYIKEQKIIKKFIINKNKKVSVELNKDIEKLYNKKTKRENLNMCELNFFKKLERKFLENEYEKIINKIKEKRKKENEERIKKEKTKRIKKLIQIKKITNSNNNEISNLIIKNSIKNNNLLLLNDQETQTYPYDFFNLDFNYY